MIALCEAWLRENLPRCEELVLLHGDYRPGNYLFDPDSGKFTAILDWELAHIGDFHQDLGYSLVGLFRTGNERDGVLCLGLMSEADLIARYESETGRRVDRGTLHFYHVLSSWSLLIMALATGLRAARDAQNHGDVLLTMLSTIGARLIMEIAGLIEKDIRA